MLFQYTISREDATESNKRSTVNASKIEGRKGNKINCHSG
jgi:hypothetical protein